jgi:hypothetical protein
MPSPLFRRSVLWIAAPLLASLLLSLGRGTAQEAVAAPLPMGWSQGPSLPAGFVPQWDMAYAYFPPLNEVVAFGGSPKSPTEDWSNQTWVFAGGAWAKGPTAPAGLTPRGGVAMAYLPDIGKMVLFGGAADAWPPYSDTWLFDGTKWTAGPAAPSQLLGRSGAEMEYLPTLHTLVLFSGSGVVPLNDTWFFNGTSWTAGPATPSTVQPRKYFGMAYDPDQQAVYVAGGDGDTDGWYFDGSAWTAGPDLSAWGPKERIRFEYDPQIDGILGFGGLGPGDSDGSMWVLKGGSWSQAPSWNSGDGWPDPRADGALVWNPAMDAVMMFAGIPAGDGSGSTALNDTWFLRDVPPVVANAVISPDPAFQGTGLGLTFGTSTGGYRTVTKQIEWYVNDVVVPDDHDIRLEVGKFGNGDQVYARVREIDDLAVLGPWVYSQTVLIGNRAPIVNSVSLNPVTAYTSSTMTAVANGVSDPEGDPVTLHYEWTVNGQALAGVDAATLTPDHFQANDVVHVTVTAVDDHGATSDPDVSVDRTIKWNLVPRNAIAPGRTVGVNGGGYAANERVDVHMDSPTGPAVGSGNADSTGAVTGLQITLPAAFPGGTHTLYGVGATSHVAGQGQLSVLSVIGISPTSLGYGDPATVTGVGFVPGENVSVRLGSGPSSSVTADATGSISLATTSPDVALGGGVVTASAPSGSDTATFTVQSRLASPTTGVPQASVPITVHGFSPTETVHVYFDSSSTVVGGFTTDANGTGQMNIALNLLFGSHTIKVTGASSLVTKTNTINLPATMTLSPTSGVVGSSVTVDSGPGWAAGSKVSLYMGKKLLATLTANTNGVVHMAGTVPNLPAGMVSVQLKGSNPKLTATAQFQIL